jgi:hypothetical protein
MIFSVLIAALPDIQDWVSSDRRRRLCARPSTLRVRFYVSTSLCSDKKILKNGLSRFLGFFGNVKTGLTGRRERRQIP